MKSKLEDIVDDVFDDEDVMEFTARCFAEDTPSMDIELIINGLLAEGWHPEERIPLGSKAIIIFSREVESNDENS